MKRDFKTKIKVTRISVFLFSAIFTAIIAFFLPVTSYFAPKLAESLGVELKAEKQNYSIFSDKAVLICSPTA